MDVRRVGRLYKKKPTQYYLLEEEELEECWNDETFLVAAGTSILFFIYLVF